MLQTLPKNVLVRDLDGNFKVFIDGKLVDLQQYELEHIPAAAQAPDRTSAVGFPTFRDLATVPEDENFRDSVAAKRPPAGGKPAVDAHFHPADRQEIASELAKIKTIFNLRAQKKYSIHKIAAKLADKHNLRLSADEAKRLAAILLGCFHQTRSFVQTRARLQETLAQGGLALDEVTTDHIVAIVRHLKDQIEKIDGVVVDETVVKEEIGESPDEAKGEPIAPLPKVTPPSPPAFRPTVVPAPKPVESATIKPSATAPARVEPSPVRPPTATVPPLPRSYVSKAGAGEAGGLAPLSLYPSSSGAAAVKRPPPTSLKPGVYDVKQPSGRLAKLTGRIDELADMTLETFRFIDLDPRVRAGKILGKIQTLEKESLTRKAQGIDAWRSTAVYRLYLLIGQKSLEGKLKVADVISDLGGQGQPSLTLEEFEAISDLNKMLRF